MCMESPPSAVISLPAQKKQSSRTSLPLSGVVLVAALCLVRSVPWFLASFITSGRSNDAQRRLTESSADSLGLWIGMAAMALVMKLAASIDDIAWLLPFLSSTHKRRSAIFYILCMQLVVFFAWGVSTGGQELLGLFVPDDPHWPLSRILELVSAILLSVYSLKLFKEWWDERHAADNEESECDSATRCDQSSKEVCTTAAVGPNGGEAIEPQVGDALEPPISSLGKTSGSWEFAWDSESQRWYFQDREEGVACWQCPPNCHIAVPSACPGEVKVRTPEGLPDGWAAAWDCQQERFYFYNSNMFLRTWEHPSLTAKKNAKSERSVSDLSCPVPPNWAKLGVISKPELKSGNELALSADQIQLDHLMEDEGAKTTTEIIAAVLERAEALEKDGAAGGSKEDVTSDEVDKHSLSKLFTIAMFGSLDDFAVFVSLLLSNVLSGAQLAVGVLCGTILVVILCMGIGKLACVVRIVESIPLWLIIGSFAVWTYISTFVMD